MRGISKGVVLILFLFSFCYPSSALTLSRRYGYDIPFNVGKSDQILKIYEDLNGQLVVSTEKNDRARMARLSALISESLLSMGLYEHAADYYRTSLRLFSELIEGGSGRTALLLRYDYANTLCRAAELYCSMADKINEGSELYLKAVDEYAVCMDGALKYGVGELGLNRLKYVMLQLDAIMWNLNLLGHDFVSAAEYAESYIERVGEIFSSEKHNHIEYVLGLYMKATVCFRAGSYEDAIGHYQSAVQFSDSILGSGSLLKGKLLGELASVYYLLNDKGKSQAILDEALKMFDKLKLPMHPYYAELLSGVGVLHMDFGHWDEAAEYLDQGYEVFVNSGCANSLMAQKNRVSYIAIYIARQQLQKALEETHKYIAQINYYGDDTVLGLLGWMVELSWILGKGNEVVASENDILKMLKAITNPSPFELYALYIAMARTFETVQGFDKACEYFCKALELQREMVHKNFLFLREDQRTSLWERDASRYQSVLKHSLYAVRGQSEHSALLYDAVLLQKGLLLEASVNLARIIDEKGTTQMKEKMNRLRLLMTSVQTEQNIMETRSLESELQKEAKALGDFVHYTETTWKDVRNSLSDNDVAIEFICVDDGGDRIYTAEILRKDMDYPYHIEIKRGDAAFEWTAILPLLRPGDNVYFSPAGDLHKEGIEYMTLSDGLRMDEKYNMYRVSSTREVLKKNDSNVFEHSIALYGGLNYSASQDDMELLAMRSSKRGKQQGRPVRSLWPYLPGTEKEIDGIASVLSGLDYKCVTVSGDYGIEESFKNISGSRFGIIHIATHGFYFQSDRNVLNHSGLIFAGANNCWLNWSGNDPSLRNANDGVLTSAEIADMNLLGTDLVVLSACNTGRGYISGEGVFGLQRAFKKAGVRSLLVSLREVDDEVTSRFMVSFYRHLTQGCTRHAALRHAQDEIREADWTSFVLID